MDLYQNINQEGIALNNNLVSTHRFPKAFSEEIDDVKDSVSRKSIRMVDDVK
jgi:hypothetical protein